MKHLRRMNESSANEYQLLLNMRKLMKSNSLFVEMATKLVENGEVSEETWEEFCEDNGIDPTPDHFTAPSRKSSGSNGSSSCGSGGLSGTNSCGYSAPPRRSSYGSSSCGSSGSGSSSCGGGGVRGC